MNAPAGGRRGAEIELVFAEPPVSLQVVVGPPRRLRRKRRVVTPSDYIAPDSHRPHGSRAKYVLERCRCEPCTAANTAYSLRRARARRRPDEVWAPYVPAGKARRHLKELAAAGIGLKSVAQLSGVPHGTLSKLVYGQPARHKGPSRRIRPDTEQAILAIQVDDAKGGQRIPAGPTWQLLEELLARGFTKTDLARRLLGPQAKSLQIDRRTVTARTAQRVVELHRRCAVLEPPQQSRVR